MNNLDISHLGINTPQSIIRNPSYDKLYALETESSLKGLEKAFNTTLGAVSVNTGAFTGRSPRDKYFVKEPSSEGNIWWSDQTNGSDNKSISLDTWNALKATTIKQLNSKNLFVQDGYCGANLKSRLSVRLVTEISWASHFAKNMFIRPPEEELENFTPDWTILHACKTSNLDWEKMGLNSEVYIAFNIAERTTLIGGTWYGGEIKKGIFSMMNYFLPLKKIGSFHCSANVGENDDSALFFGLSGTGKTTLSTDPKRKLIGDDEHGWDDEGIFNFEGGCYAKTIDLSAKKEPEIYNAIKRDALLENVSMDKSGKVDFASREKTENTRVSYPIYHIKNIVEPISKGPAPKNIVFLTCDAFGVLPPVAILTKEQAMYQYLSGYTAKVAGTERGITEPKATFSPCFGGPFLTLHPIRYAKILGVKMDHYQANAYLVNTGWSGGGYGTGKRMSLDITRKVIDGILNGKILDSPSNQMPIFNFRIPMSVEGIDSDILCPTKTWENKENYDKTLIKLGCMFIENFKRFTDSKQCKLLQNYGPLVK